MSPCSSREVRGRRGREERGRRREEGVPPGSCDLKPPAWQERRGSWGQPPSWPLQTEAVEAQPSSRGGLLRGPRAPVQSRHLPNQTTPAKAHQHGGQASLALSQSGSRCTVGI